MRVIDMVQYWARAAPDRLAIVQSEMVTTYSGLADAIETIGERIERLNLDKRQPVGVCLANPSFMLATIFALWRCGYSVAPVSVALYPHLAEAGIRDLIYDTQSQMISGGRNIRFDISWLPDPKQGTVKRAYRSRPIESVDTIFFTSGTTGLPKKVVQAAGALEELLKYPFTCASGAHQTVLIMPGLRSTFGFNRLCEVLNVGKTACFAQDSEVALSLIGLFAIEVIIASASQALLLAETKNKMPAYRLDSLKDIYVGGGTIGPEGIALIRSALCRTVINQYGSTEAGVVALTPFELLADTPGAIALPWAELQIVDETGQVLSAGAEGLVRYRTQQLAENLKVAGADGLPGVSNGWFYPGDIGSFTSGEVLRLTGRNSDVLNRGGVKVSAGRIEEILRTLPEIKEAAACSVAGLSGLEEIWIAVVVTGPVEIEEIKMTLAKHKDIGLAPDEVFTVAELPRGDLGKVQKYRLRELLLIQKKAAE